MRALIGLTKTAVELGPSGVRANALCPGSVVAERLEAEEKGITLGELREEWVRGFSATSVTADDVAA